MRVIKTTFGVAAGLLGVNAAGASTGIVFPSDAGIIDLATFGAFPNDGIDDTAAIQAALNAYPSGNTVFYFADGVYDISASLKPKPSNGVAKRNIFQGQSRDGTILKFKNNQNFTGALIDYGGGAAQFFRNGVRNMTIDTGTGNPSAIGLRFNASNQGAVRDVTIRSGDGFGSIGLDFSVAGEPGPLLIKDVRVEGFNTGLKTVYQTASQTIYGLDLVGQKTVGWHNTQAQSVFAENVRSTNTVTAILNNEEARMALINSSLLGGSSANTAIRNQKAMYVRNVQTGGYGQAISNELTSNRGNQGIVGPYIDEYWANGSSTNRRGGPMQLFDSPDTTLRLPIRPTPTVEWHPLSQWARPAGNATGTFDATAAIQAAINSGAKTIYLPRGEWRIDGTVTLGPNTVRIIGTEARLSGNGTIRIADGNESTVIIERLEISQTVKIEHASDRTLVLSSLIGGRYIPALAATGDLFIEDANLPVLNVSNQNVWARQLNLERDVEGDPTQSAKLVNNNANLYVLGLKTEDPGTLVRTINGGRTELIGSLHVSRHGVDPTFVTEDASFVAVLTQNTTHPTTPLNRIVRETRNGVTLTGVIGDADMYTAFAAGAIAAREVIYDNASPAFQFTGSWTTSTSLPGGFIESDFAFSNAPNAQAVLSAMLPSAGQYQVAIRWIDDRSGQDHAGHATAATIRLLTSTGWQTFSVDMRSGGGQWFSLGDFQFASDFTEMQFLTNGAGGKVIVDGVRFVVVPEPGVLGVLLVLPMLARRRANRTITL
ncbi:glycosyl hydrolase family 28-related protein [Oscillatoria amoena NRMC-F 0135]|nr:glycosyl hydrolase family 28-related protein [Oscillatoria amoena NRMC-F 0135]